MGILREIPPTAGFPLYPSDLLSLFKKGSFEEDLKAYLGVDFVSITYSGTAALYLILEALKSFSSKTTVVIPAYVCPLVPLAIARAGLKVEVCDIQPDSFDFNLAELENICLRNNDILAIIAVHLAGIPVDFESLKKISRPDIFIVEDCAQSLGAEYKGKKVGTFGDFSFFSFCRGKGLTIYEGGGIVTNNGRYALAINKEAKQLVKKDLISESLKIMELFGYWIFYRPGLFWFVFSLPQLFWNFKGEKLRAAMEYFSVDFPIHRVSGLRKKIGHAQFSRLGLEIIRQREKAHVYINGLDGIRGIKAVKGPKNALSTYPYLTLIFQDLGKRNRALKLLERTGLGVSGVYAYAITGYDYLKVIVPAGNCPNARNLAERQLTLSTSIFLKPKDQSLILSIIKNL